MTYPVLDGKVAIITGAAMGMGEATARLFGEAGAKVVVADFNEEKGRAATDALVADGLDAYFVATDVSNAASVERMVAATVERYGRLDCAVNNAAAAPDTHPVTEFDEAQFDRIMAVDLKGVALCMKYEIRQFLAQGGGGAIVNISSVSGVRPQPNNIAYVGAKHAVIGMTKTAALEYGAQGVRVNSVGPGAVDTPMMTAALEQLQMTEAEFAPVLSLLNRFAQPREIAEASLWLCSDASSFVTGALFMVDAGYTSR